jgi:hypothetical protein
MDPAVADALAQRCDNIRWKGMFIDAEWDPAAGPASEHVCWCVMTQNCIGPDGQVVGEDVCNATRSCYVTV